VRRRAIVGVHEAAELLRVPPRQLYRMLKRHEIRGAFNGRAWHVDLADLKRLVKTKTGVRS
jgi:excisionase family DNA binding protein